MPPENDTAGFFPELKKTIRLSAPIALGLGGQGALFAIDTMMAGWLGEVPLAAAAFAGNLVVVPYVFGLGLAVSVPVLTAQSRGAGNFSDGAHALRHGLVITGVFSVIVGLAIHFGIGVMDYFGQDESILPDAKKFGVLMGWSILPGLLFQCLKNHREAIGQPWVSLFWLLGGVIANVIFAWIFMFGKFGAPAMGLAGAGLGTLLARTLMLAGLALHPHGESPKWHLGIQKIWLARSFELAIPSALQSVFEIGVFAAAPVLIGLFSKSQQAAHQVAVSIASMAFMIPLGISQAASIRVGEAFGAKDTAALRRISIGALIFGTGFMSLYGIGVICFNRQIPLLYLDNGTAGETILFASQYLVVAAAFALGDGFQVVASGALRGISDVRFASIAAFVCYWLISAPVALAFACGAKLEGLGVWIGLAAGIFAASVALGGRLFFKLKNCRF